mmetsp:Transcript_18407/g.43012  ORF Transcript_18407/g.43012 Transcript_18407/m.43012 type:complete len:128 (+) Transcript_18407:81-464(+)
MATGVVTFCGVPTSLSSFEKLPFEEAELINGRKAYKADVMTKEGHKSFGIWYNDDKELYLLAPMECLDMKDKFACYAACPAGEAEDPTQLTSQWVTTTTEGWEPHPDMFCAPAKIVEKCSDKSSESD